jgi:hypothetical protein
LTAPVRVIAALAAGVALVAAGCGDEEESTATGASGAPSSRAEFIAEADAICRRYLNELDRAAAEAFRGRTSAKEIERYISDEFAPATEDELAEIRALTPPAGDEEEVDAILDAAENAVDAVGDNPSLFSTGSPFAKANRLASEYGLRVCGQGDGGPSGGAVS